MAPKQYTRSLNLYNWQTIWNLSFLYSNHILFFSYFVFYVSMCAPTTGCQGGHCGPEGPDGKRRLDGQGVQFRMAPFQASDRAALSYPQNLLMSNQKKSNEILLDVLCLFSVSAYNCIPTTKKEVLFRLYWLSEMSTCRLWNIEQKGNWRRPTWNGSNHHIFPNLFIFSNQMFTASCRRFSTRKASSTKSSRI